MVTTVVDRLCFANGVALTAEMDAVLVAEPPDSPSTVGGERVVRMPRVLFVRRDATRGGMLA